MNIRELATLPNLELAWRRITTGGNTQYKRFFRNLYYTYEVALDENLRDLRARLRGGSFLPSHPQRILVPKASGLHRPLSLLTIEDQVVLQAFANVVARKMQRRREPLQFKVIFSNILQRRNSIFFFQRWQDTYAGFQKRIGHLHGKGMHWVGDFDLAAFYETISHHLLLRTIFPKTSSSPGLDWISECLRTWSSGHAESRHDHGLPQGPLASDFLAECFLLPVDEALVKRFGYLRYVDDVRLLGESEDQVRKKLIELERRCRERGLIPQVGKFSIKRAHSAAGAMGLLPSIADPKVEEGQPGLTGSQALAILKPAIAGRPQRVVEKTRLRYALFRAEADSQVLRLVLRLLPRHPEHADAFFFYLARFGYRKPIERICLQLATQSPYDFVRGEAWQVLARYRRIGKLNRVRLSESAVEIARAKGQGGFMESWGACRFLCACEEAGEGRLSNFLKFQPALLQAFSAKSLPSRAFHAGGAVKEFLRRSSIEPGLSVCPEIHRLGLTLKAFELEAETLPSQLVNTLRRLGSISAPDRRVDPIAEILARRYGTPEFSWHDLLQSDYVHALGLLVQAEAAFDSGRSFWLSCQNSFNQTLFFALQRELKGRGHPGACKIVGRDGRLVDFGVTLDRTGPFSRNCSDLADSFRDVNARRNRLPVSHPYDKVSAAKNKYLEPKERNKLVEALQGAYEDVVALLQ